ncbi:kinase-like protein [Coprinellus micaceus]|uniref:Kinase-like protein n=1 Tax=Coprinellus micaceus TaxID=71717 RepID=A0A4Y7SUE2_COPMI|nr:kinase-like protein [Coprinellus micaceus]
MSQQALVTLQIPDDLTISSVDVQIAMDSVSWPDSMTNIYRGFYRGQPARFKELRPLHCYVQAGVGVRSILLLIAFLRRQHPSSRHVPISGVYQEDASLGGRVFLVESPYRYVGLREYIAANPGAERRLLLKRALEIIVDLHSRGLVHGIVRSKSFVVDSSGKLLLSEFEMMRMEDPNTPFHPIGGLSVATMAFAAPELLDSLRSNGSAPLTKAADMYSMGCFAYELFTGKAPFVPNERHTSHMAQVELITAVVDHNTRPERPPPGSNAQPHSHLTGEVWGVIEECWDPVPASRPSAVDLLRRLH